MYQCGSYPIANCEFTLLEVYASDISELDKDIGIRCCCVQVYILCCCQRIFIKSLYFAVVSCGWCCVNFVFASRRIENEHA